jgi:hypothetical protein
MRMAAFTIAIFACCLGGKAGAEERHALVVGCSQYPFSKQRPLIGAANDAQFFEGLLARELGFKVTALFGWPDDEMKRPTHGNICAGFQELVESAAPDAQIFIYLAGHGSQVRNAAGERDEPDGKDEVFMAADDQPIVDDQVGAWLDAMKAKGAHVWIIFDSCFSGTMMRGDAAEPTRLYSAPNPAPAQAANAPADASSTLAGPELAARSRSHDGFELPKDDKGQGSVVAFYAAQDFEPAPEVRRPKDAERVDANFHGLLSYHLQQSMRQAVESMTYRELSRRLVSAYRADGRLNPTPAFEGDLDREVLGFKEWPDLKPLLLEREGEPWRLTAGQMAGVTDGAILSVHRLDDREGKELLGHVRVTKASATAASVEGVAFGDGPEKLDLAKLPREGARCRIVSQDWGNQRLQLAVAAAPGAQSAALAQQLKNAVQPCVDPNKAGGLASLIDDLSVADWVLVATEPAVAFDWFRVRVEVPAAFLLSGNAARSMLTVDDKAAAAAYSLPPHQVPAHYALDDLMRSVRPLEEDLQKIFAWNNLWRVANDYGSGSPLVAQRDVQLEISTGAGEAPTRLKAGDHVEVRVVNRGYASYWYEVFFLNERFGIEQARSFSGAIEGKGGGGPKSREVIGFDVSPALRGTNGFVVIAMPQKHHPNRPEYGFLKQSALGEPGRRAAPDVTGLATPFEKLLLNAVAGGSGTRSSISPDEPQMASWSWVTVPEESP